MKKAGNRCELVGYPGAAHGWFTRDGYEDTLKKADAFLVSLGWLAPAPYSKPSQRPITGL